MKLGTFIILLITAACVRCQRGSLATSSPGSLKPVSHQTLTTSPAQLYSKLTKLLQSLKSNRNHRLFPTAVPHPTVPASPTRLNAPRTQRHDPRIKMAPSPLNSHHTQRHDSRIHMAPSYSTVPQIHPQDPKTEAALARIGSAVQAQMAARRTQQFQNPSVEDQYIGAIKRILKCGRLTLVRGIQLSAEVQRQHCDFGTAFSTLLLYLPNLAKEGLVRSFQLGGSLPTFLDIPDLNFTMLNIIEFTKFGVALRQGHAPLQSISQNQLLVTTGFDRVELSATVRTSMFHHRWTLALDKPQVWASIAFGLENKIDDISLEMTSEYLAFKAENIGNKTVLSETIRMSLPDLVQQNEDFLRRAVLPISLKMWSPFVLEDVRKTIAGNNLDFEPITE